MASLEELFKKVEQMKKQASPFYAPTGTVEYIVAGLGNPGREYENTRHNAGFMAIAALEQKYGFQVDKLKFKSLCGDGMVAGKRVLFLKPSTYMNKSGEAVTEAMSFYKIPPEQVVLLFDDISLEPGRLRVRRKGSDGGHNGMKNIIYLSGSNAFPRIKIGVGQKPNPEYNLADWVLSRFSPDELEAVKSAAQKAAQGVELIVSGKMDEAMNLLNVK